MCDDVTQWSALEGGLALKGITNVKNRSSCWQVIHLLFLSLFVIRSHSLSHRDTSLLYLMSTTQQVKKWSERKTGLKDYFKHRLNLIIDEFSDWTEVVIGRFRRGVLTGRSSGRPASGCLWRHERTNRFTARSFGLSEQPVEAKRRRHLKILKEWVRSSVKNSTQTVLFLRCFMKDVFAGICDFFELLCLHVSCFFS